MDELSLPTKQVFDERSIEITSEMLGLVEELSDRVAALREQAKADEEFVTNAINEQLAALQHELFTTNGVPDGQHNCWVIDTRYVNDHGIVYLLLNEQAYKEQVMLEKRLTAPADN